MNLFRPQQRYQFRPPRYSPFLTPLLLRVGEFYLLHRKFKIRNIHIEGMERLAALHREGHSLLMAPNHGDHADPHVLLHAGRRHGLKLHFMAAREGFESGPFNAWLLQRCGAFSVDREGADLSAIKTAIQLLQNGRFALVIFPEGEIYHHHERLDPLNEGVATILLRAFGKLKAGRKAFLAPMSIRYIWDDAIAETFCARLSRLEQRITWKPRRELPVVERIYRLGSGLLAIKEIEFFGEACAGSLPERISGLRDRLVCQLEEKHLPRTGTGSIPERVKALRGKIRKQMTDPVPPAPEVETELYDDLDRLFVVVQLYSYPGQYLREQPTTDRIAETILKLEEDVLGSAEYSAYRDVVIQADEPIDVADFLQNRQLDSKNGVRPLTIHMADRIQKLIEAVPGPATATVARLE